jgi:RHS repeat-associated protein
VYFLLVDHLGSTTITAYGTTGEFAAEVRYKAWGEDRYTSGATPTTYRYTGQRQESYINIYYYGARWYDQDLARFISPDTIVPQAGDPQQLNRFSYTRNNSLI